MNELTLTNLPGHLRIMDDLGIKPNYSQLARMYGIDRHTVAKIHKNKGICPRKGRPKCSEWDKYAACYIIRKRKGISQTSM